MPRDNGGVHRDTGTAVLERPARPTPSDSLRSTLARIFELSGLPRDWDTEGAAALSPRAIALACLLVEAVAEDHELETGRRVAPVAAVPLADGGLQLEWLGPAARIDVQVAPDATLGYLLKRGVGATATYEESDDVDLETLSATIARVAAG